MADEKYNGWTNYETWLVNVWISNSENDTEFWHEMALQAVHDNALEPCPDGAAIREVAEALKDWVEDTASEYRLEGLLADLMGAAIRSVNWDELARHYIKAAWQEAGDV